MTPQSTQPAWPLRGAALSTPKQKGESWQAATGTAEFLRGAVESGNYQHAATIAFLLTGGR